MPQRFMILKIHKKSVLECGHDLVFFFWMEQLRNATTWTGRLSLESPSRIQITTLIMPSMPRVVRLDLVSTAAVTPAISKGQK